MSQVNIQNQGVWLGNDMAPFHLPPPPSLVVVFLDERGQLGRVFFDIHEAHGQRVPLGADQIASIVEVLQISLLQFESNNIANKFLV
jgi:ABC-type phosphate/phosphonate transport system permease subunit